MARFPKNAFALLALSLALSACGGDKNSSPVVGNPAPQNSVDPFPLQPLGSAPGRDATVRIKSINNRDAINHPNTIYVHPGDVIHLSAELFLYGYAQNRNSSEFSWRAADGRICQGDSESSCYNSGFFLDDGGVSLVVPNNIGSRMTIYVWLTGAPSEADQLVLQNIGANFEFNDQHYQQFPRWNPNWNPQGRGRWNCDWDRGWDRKRGNRKAHRPGKGPCS
jgi:hypothetical protein